MIHKPKYSTNLNFSNMLFKLDVKQGKQAEFKTSIPFIQVKSESPLCLNRNPIKVFHSTKENNFHTRMNFIH